jgi:AcrR family transcriptional regulator
MRTRAEQKADTRQRLVDAGALVVAAKGVDGASVDAIAAAAGVTSGAFYASFRGKSELLKALVAERNTDLSGIPLAEIAPSLGQRLDALLDANPVDAGLFNELLAAAGRDADLRAEMGTRILANVEALSRRLDDEGMATRLPSRDTALLLQVLVAGTIALRQVIDTELPPTLLSDAIALLQDER